MLLHELGVALLELKEPHAVGEELLGRPGVILLEPHELQPAFGDPDAAALGCGEVLGKSLEGVALGLCHLSGGARRLLDVCGGSHLVTSMVVSKSLLLCSYHIYIQCKPRSVSPFGFAPIHSSAWKGYSANFAGTEVSEVRRSSKESSCFCKGVGYCPRRMERLAG